MTYRRLVLRADGSQVMRDFTADETAEKTAGEQAASSEAQYTFLRKLRRYQSIERLKGIALGGGANALIAADILHAQMIEPTDPDPGQPT